MRDLIISFFVSILIVCFGIFIFGVISNFSEWGWKFGLSPIPIWIKCDKVQEKFPTFDEKYVVKEFKSGRLDSMIEPGWFDYGLGAHIDRMEYVILYYKLAENVTLEVRLVGEFFDDSCDSGQWPPKIKERDRTIWYHGLMLNKSAHGKSYKWLKKHPEFWELKWGNKK